MVNAQGKGYEGNIGHNQHLILLGADVNQANRLGDTALWVACDLGNEDIVDALLRYKYTRDNVLKVKYQIKC